jgi:hypothetical protein
MPNVKTTHDLRSGRITGRIRLVPLGAMGSRTHFGVETQRDHVKGSLLDALARHGIPQAEIELPVKARMQLGEQWDARVVAGPQRPFLIRCAVTRRWTMRPVLRFEVLR